MASEPISTAYFKNPSHQSVCLCVCICIPKVARQRYRYNEFTKNNRRHIGTIVFYTVRVVSKESVRILLPERPVFAAGNQFEKR
jgi:hypothetical protein